MRFLVKTTLLLAFGISFFSCTKPSEDVLYSGFVNPPADARPFVRWWWLGNRITENEIVRQLDVMKEAGLGGVEINPIALPPEADSSGTTSLRWLSPEWNRMVRFASEEAKKRTMITDLIVGSGWPFGGEFLAREEMVQRVIINSIRYHGGNVINENFRSLLEKAFMSQSRPAESEAVSNELLFADLVPVSMKDTSDIINVAGRMKSDGSISFTVPAGDYDLIYGIVQRGHREVTGGAPGAAGPVMDHYKKEVTLAYLERLIKISEDTGVPLSKLIRALFCDSIELAGANWTDGFDTIFNEAYGYRIEPWLPFIFYEPYRGYEHETYDIKIQDQLRRVRYDYNRLLVKIFLENFTRTFQDFCTQNGVLCRYQAYGTPFLMGMMEGNMIPDIPESNNWIYSVDMETDEWIWNQDHGYMIWNLYAASGGHLTGRKIISCEAMTNTRGAFKSSLGEIKRHDDMNFITGINHTVLHGYNYSPAEKGFPGWVRFGEYFSEKNTWWPYFKKWTDYNARLSFVFQNSKPVKKIAILGPTADIWSDRGLPRVPFHKEPWYCYRLWEPLSNAGTSCDYIDESILKSGRFLDGTLGYGPMNYEAVILCHVRSIEPETATALKDFAARGGKIVFVGGVPDKSLSLSDADGGDSFVKQNMNELVYKYPDRAFIVKGPDSQENLLPWANGLLSKTGIGRDVIIAEPDKNIFQIRKTAGDRDIYFLVNSNLTREITINAEFPIDDKTPWIWNPEDGSRSVYAYGKNPGKLALRLQPLQSMLIVFEPGRKDKAGEEAEAPGQALAVVQGPWEAEFIHHNGKSFRRTFDVLKEFGTSDDPELNSFAGTVKYLTEFESDGTGKWLLLPDVNKGVTELILNGDTAGVNWYGKPVFRIDRLLKQGNNRLEIRYTTVLSNYVRSLKDNPAAMRWAKDYVPLPSGLEGEITIIR